MDKFLADRIQLTVDNYRLVKEELRNDGDIINHFASLIFSHYEREIPIYRVKEIKKKYKIKYNKGYHHLGRYIKYTFITNSNSW